MDFFSFRYRNRPETFEDPRRDFLVKALTMGVFAGGLVWPGARGVQAMASPRALPPGRAIHRVTGDVRVDGEPARPDTSIASNAEIETGSGGELIFAVGTDAFIMRENSRLALAPIGDEKDAPETSERLALIDGLRLLSGKLLSVFGTRGADQRLRLRTPTATIGIRGTGVYLEADTDRTYVCTCYGDTILTATGDPQSREAIAASHHDEPRYILGEGAAGSRIEPAPMIGHTDMELQLIEELVGRRLPFDMSSSGYGAAGY